MALPSPNRTAVPVHFAVAVCHDGEVVRSVAGQLRLADRRAKLIPAAAFPGGASAYAVTAGLRLIFWRRGDAAPAVTGYGVK